MHTSPGTALSHSKAVPFTASQPPSKIHERRISGRSDARARRRQKSRTNAVSHPPQNKAFQNDMDGLCALMANSSLEEGPPSGHIGDQSAASSTQTGRSVESELVELMSNLSLRSPTVGGATLSSADTVEEQLPAEEWWDEEAFLQEDEESVESFDRDDLAEHSLLLQHLSPWPKKGPERVTADDDGASLSCASISSADTEDDTVTTSPSEASYAPKETSPSPLPIFSGARTSSIAARVAAVGIRSDWETPSVDWSSRFFLTFHSLAVDTTASSDGEVD